MSKYLLDQPASDVQTAINNALNIDKMKYVTPQMYGAVGDGVVDDTVAINLALATGETVFFPKGTYLVTSALIVPNGTRMTGAGEHSIILTTIHDGFVFNGQSESGAISTTLYRVSIENLYFDNGCEQDSETMLRSGNFIHTARDVYMCNCRVKGYANVFDTLNATTRLVNNHFTGIYCSFARSAVDAMIHNNYINASVYGMPHHSKCFTNDISSTVLSNNFIDYFHDCFAVKYSSGTKIIGNTFARTLAVFHDYVAGMTVNGNVFSNIKYIASDWSKLTAEQQTALQNEKWCAIKYDGELLVNMKSTMMRVSFTNNISNLCDNYIYMVEGMEVVAAACEFRGNKLTSNTSNTPSAVDVGFRNWTSTEDAHNSFKDVYFDFWDMKEYEELPSPTLRVNKAKGVKSFPFMRAIRNGELYINVNGEWRIASPSVYDGGVS